MIDSRDFKLLFVGSDASSEAQLSAKALAGGLGCASAGSVHEAVDIVRKNSSVDTVFLFSSDKTMLGDLAAFIAVSSQIKVIAVVDNGNERLGIDAMRKGAFDYLVRPVDDAVAAKIIANLVYLQDLTVHLGEMKRKIRREKLYPDIVGESSAVRDMLEQLDRLADKDVNVLIYGESGTGKELVARGIYENSRRKDKKFITVNMGAITPELSESLLFGHRRGSFTGAMGDHQGYFEQAGGGVLFFDEIGDMRMEVQVYLLRALEERRIRPVGGREEMPIDVRVISATNKNLRQEIAEKRFRSDLLYRLEEYPIELPPLRARKEDIPLLSNHFVKEYCRFYELEYIYISDRAMNQLMDYDWPGNIRELKNVVRRAAVQVSDSVIESFSLTGQEKEASRPARKDESMEIIPLAELEQKAITEAYNKLGRNADKAAVMLGISRASIYRKLKQYGVI